MWVSPSSASAVDRSGAAESDFAASASRGARRICSSARSAKSGEGDGSYGAHVPVFPSGQPPASIVLEPYPNCRVQSTCVAGGLLVTAHRNGIRIFRQRCDRAESNRAGDVRTGLWELVEARGDFYLRDAYLCDAAEQVFVSERVLPVKWNCYVAAACGSDRTEFSVCVLSTAARFLLHHELHGRNRIAALSFGLIPMEPRLTSRRFRALVVSIDEVGEVVVYDVERDCAVKLRERREVAMPREGRAGEPPSPCGAVDNSAADSPSDLRVYRLAAGLASRISLVGPCQVLCKRCCSEAVASSGVNMSLFVTSHAHSAEGHAELHVQHLRFFFGHSPIRAVLLSDEPIVRECARENVCELGVAVLRAPFHPLLPTRFMIARPRLRFWSLSGCTGELLRLHRIYRDTDGGGKGARTAREYFVHIVPLGRYSLVQDPSTSWLCCAALTNDDTVLLLGQDPASVGRVVGMNDRCKDNIEDYDSECITGEDHVCTHNEAAEERRVLEAWLDDAEAPNSESKSNADENNCLDSDFVSGNCRNAPPDDPSAPLPSSFADSKEGFTVLVVLASPRNGDSGVARCTKGRALLFLPQSSELLLFLGQTDTFLSIGLPFVRPPVSSALHPAPRSGALGAAPPVGGAWGGAAVEFGIARPLFSSFLRLAGGREADTDAMPRMGAEPLVADVSVNSAPQAPLQSQVASVAHVHVNDAGEVVSSPRRRLPRRRRPSSGVVCVEDRRSGIDRSEVECEGEDARRAYVRAEQEKLLEARQRHITEDIGSAYAVAVAQLIEMEEPLQRNTIAYAWSDEHDAMYVRHVQEAVEIAGPAKRDEQSSTAACIPSECSVRNRLVMDEVNRGCQSVGFMQAYRHLQCRRQDLLDHGDVFDFSAYFADGVVPPRLLELQEDDRCRFELADLRAAFEDDMRQFTNSDTVTVYENEERAQDSNKRRRWMPHSTFPYDDANGEVIDIVALNATAAAPSEAQAAPGWRWASDTRVTTKVVRKELCAWDIGEWQYAERWPTREEEVSGSFQWAEQANAEAKVRRRCLTRVRVNIAAEAAMEARRQEYEREQEALRAELGL